MEPATCRQMFASSPIARMATVGPTRPHLVPVTFAVEEDHIYSAVDHKPKVSRQLRRLANIRNNPAVSLLVDHYDDDWSHLWWVRADGVAVIVDDPDEMTRGLDRLVAKYPQYQQRRPSGPLIDIAVTGWRGWSAT